MVGCFGEGMLSLPLSLRLETCTHALAFTVIIECCQGALQFMRGMIWLELEACEDSEVRNLFRFLSRKER